MPTGLALLMGALTALAPIGALHSQDTPKRQTASSPQPAKVKPQQRRPSKTAKAKPAPSAKKATVSGIPLESSAQTQAWVEDAAQRLQLDPIWLKNTLSQAKRLPSVERFVLPPSSPTAKNWAVYRARFIEPTRIQAGARFWQTHRSALERAEREYGVPASMIVGIIGVETLYGQNTGNFRILDALATLTFHFPSAHPRASAR
jgi:membrane-bound lytic murein transglycosylase B